ncbi:MAG: dinitrogenase iron-molybdenum cofactor biosynthesis protein [Actinobacteria bacterium HGW-Actinobacteria-10]|nr:MAG: dinitrogenase iron-molybdenum cofactor biosynthesis protein [Actinobacteria bacterium HGW-Actinobacteria-10]
MAENMVLAIPSMGEGGLEAERSGHFGHCDCFTLVEIVDGAIADVRVVENPPHEEGGCLRPVNLLASHGVQALIVAGMGARPLAGFDAAGITVFYEGATPRIGDAVQLVLDDNVMKMDARHVCGGH